MIDRHETAEEVFVPVVAVGGIRTGLLAGKRPAINERRLPWFLAQDGVSVFGIDASVSHRYAETHGGLKRKGTPSPTSDLGIAATDIEDGLALYARNRRLTNVPGLAVLCVGDPATARVRDGMDEATTGNDLRRLSRHPRGSWAAGAQRSFVALVGGATRWSGKR